MCAVHTVHNGYLPGVVEPFANSNSTMRWCALCTMCTMVTCRVPWNPSLTVTALYAGVCCAPWSSGVDGVDSRVLHQVVWGDVCTAVVTQCLKFNGNIVPCHVVLETTDFLLDIPI